MINDDTCKRLGNRKFLLYIYISIYNPGFLTTCGPWDGHPRVQGSFSIAVSGQDAPELHGTVIFPADLFHSLKHTSARDTLHFCEWFKFKSTAEYTDMRACKRKKQYVRNHFIGFRIVKPPLPSATQNITGITSDFRFFGFHLTKDNTNSLGKLVTYQKK